MNRLSSLMCLIFIFSIPWENAFTLPGVGTLCRAIGIGTSAIWVITVAKRRKLRVPHLYHFATVMFILWNILSCLWSFDPDESVHQASVYLQLGLMTFLVWDLLRSGVALQWGLQAYVLGAFVSTIGSLVNFIEGTSISAYEAERYSGAGINAVELVVILSLALPIAWYLATSPEVKLPRVLKIINSIFSPIVIFSIAITGARTSFFTLVPAIWYIVWSLKKFKIVSKIVLTQAFVIALVGSFILIPNDTWIRLASVGDSIISFDLGRRGEIWKDSFNVFTKHPLLGIGAGTLHSPQLLGVVAHNTYLSVLSELGILGSLLFTSILAIVGAQAVQQYKTRNSLWIAVLMIWMIGCISLSWELTKTTWLFLTIIVMGNNNDIVNKT